jgi:type II secretory pathway component PulM
MKSLLSSRTPRERTLLMLAAALLAAALLWQLVLSPLFQIRRDTQQSHARASQTLALLSTIEGLAKSGKPSSSGPITPESLAEEMSRLAQVHGLEVVMVDTSSSGQAVSIRNADTGQIFAWLSDVEQTLSIKLMRSEIIRKESGEVDARLEFKGSVSP